MSFNFNADEIFEMAEGIERNLAGFFRRAADNTRDPAVQDLMLELAAMEDCHEKYFADMRKALSDKERESTLFDPNDESALYLKALVESRVLDWKADPAEKFTGRETVEDLLRMSIGLEKESISFYVGMKGMVPERLGKSKIDDIIKEEMRHVASLSDKLISLRKD